MRRSIKTTWIMLCAVLAACAQQSNDTYQDERAREGMGSAGGAVATARQVVTLEIPEGALAEPVTITIDPARAVPDDPHYIPGTAFEFGPDGQRFEKPVTMRLRYDPARLPEGMLPSTLRMHKVVNQAWQMIEGSRVHEQEQVVVAELTSFSTYGLRGAPGLGGDEVAFSWQQDGGAVDASGDAGQDAPSADAAVAPESTTQECTWVAAGGGAYPSCDVEGDCAPFAAGGLAHCNVPSKLCVACTDNAHCAATMSQPANPKGSVCVKNTPSFHCGCSENAHCTKGVHNTGLCSSAGRCTHCTDDADCRDAQLGQGCVKGRCERCGEDAHCVEGPYNTGKCVSKALGADEDSYQCQRCDTDAECVESKLGRRCDPESKRCVACMRHSDCPGGKEETGWCFDSGSTRECVGCQSQTECTVAFGDGATECQ